MAVKGLFKKVLSIGMPATISAFSLLPSSANAVEIKKGQAGDKMTYEVINAQDKEEYQTEKANDPNAQAIRLWLINQAQMYTDIPKIQNFSDSLDKIIKENSDAVIEWDLNKGYVKVTDDDFKKHIYEGFIFKEKPAVKNEVKEEDNVKEDNIEKLVDLAEAQQPEESEEKKEPEKQEYASEKPKEVKEKKRKSKIREIVEEAKKKKPEEVKEVKKAKKAKYKTSSEERDETNAKKLKYYLTGDIGYEEQYKYGNLDLFFNIQVGTTTLSEVKAGIRPSTHLFRLSNEEYILDYLNEGNKVAGYVKLDKDEKIIVKKLLFKKDLEDLVFEYETSDKRKGEIIKDILKNYEQLRDRDIHVVRDLKKEYKDGIVFVRTPERKNVYGIANVVEDEKIADKIELNKEQYTRVSQPDWNISLTNGLNYNAVEWLLSGDERVEGVRGKANAVYDDNMLKQSQLVFSFTNKNNKKLIVGSSFFADKIGNYDFTEADVFLRYLTDTLKVNVLTGTTEDKEKYADTSVNNMILQQTRNGKSNPLVNIGIECTSPGETPIVRGKPTLETRIARVDGTDILNYTWLDNNSNVLAQGSIPYYSEYFTASANFKNKWFLDEPEKSGVELVIGAETNDFRQKTFNKSNIQSRAGFIGEYKGDNLNVLAMVLYQMNKDSEKGDINNLAEGIQIACKPTSKTAVILGGNYEGLNDSKELTLDFAYSPLLMKRYIENEGAYTKEKIAYNTLNNASMLPSLNPSLSHIPSIVEGIQLSLSAGSDKYKTNFCKAVIDAYVGRGFSIGGKYEKKGNDTKSTMTIKKAFR